jgi:hypothetical protein
MQGFSGTRHFVDVVTRFVEFPKRSSDDVLQQLGQFASYRYTRFPSVKAG